jgi:hypothetical protein
MDSLRRQNRQWKLWMLSVLTIVIGAVANHIFSRSIKVPIVLRSGATVEIDVFRIKSCPVRLEVSFDEPSNPVHGRYISKIGDGYIEFPEPGEPLLLKVEGLNRLATFEATPAINRGPPVRRRLSPFQDDGNPNRFPRLADLNNYPRFNAGFSTISVTVERIGQQLIGKEAQIIVVAPLGFKESTPGCGTGFLFWFYLWPFYALPLTVWGVFLVTREKRIWDKS